MIVAALALAVIVYGWGLRRVARLQRSFPAGAIVAFSLGILVLGLSLFGPMDGLADASLSWHMVQHLALVGIVAPLLLLGAPLRLALSALPARPARLLSNVLASGTMRFLTHPAVAWLQFAAVLYGAHFSPLYEAALENQAVHAFEHVLFLSSALVFWTPLLAVSPAPHAPTYPVRLLALFLALPMSSFLGFIFYVSRRVLYAHYAGETHALDDQMNAGAVMWIAGGTPLFVALLWIVADWYARERRFEAVRGGGLG